MQPTSWRSRSARIQQATQWRERSLQKKRTIVSKVCLRAPRIFAPISPDHLEARLLAITGGFSAVQLNENANFVFQTQTKNSEKKSDVSTRGLYEN